MKSILVRERGGVDVLSFTDVPKPKIERNDILLKVSAAGVNFADIMQHQGTYPLQLPLPYTPGMETIGIVEDIGSNVKNVRIGERIAAVSFVAGGYAEYVLIKPEQIIRVPDEISDRHALALAIQGLTAYLLLNYAAKIRPGESVLVHAAAGGVGNLLVQIAKLMNAGDVLGTAGTVQKRNRIKSWGVDYAIDYNNPNWHEDILEITNGEGVDIILDPVGGFATAQNLSCLAVEGRFVNYGWLSGDYPSLTPEQCQNLLFKNQSVSGFAVNVVMERHPNLVEAAFQQLFNWVLQGKLKPVLSADFPLEDAAKAHQAILNRKTMGKVILTLSKRLRCPS